MGFFDKVKNRAAFTATKLNTSLDESLLQSYLDDVRQELRQWLAKLSVHALLGEDLSWLYTSGNSALGDMLSRHGKLMAKELRALHAEKDLELTPDSALEIIAGDEALTERYLHPLETLADEIIEVADQRQFRSVVAPEPFEELIEEMSTSLDKYVEKVSKLRTRIGEATDALSQMEAEYGEMGETISEELKKRGKGAASTANKQLDVISGKELLAVVQARLDLQARYNDVLASKLDEVLTRLEQLERKLMDA